MRRTIIILGIALIALNCAGLLLFRAPSTHAKGWGFSNNDLWGSYASQWSGYVNFPEGHPFKILNGPEALNGRVTADGQGNASGTVYDSYNGLLLNYSWTGTYQVAQEGTVKLQTLLDLAALGVKVDFVAYGVICDDGKQVKWIHTGPTLREQGIPGVPPILLGTVSTGSWTRQ